MFGSYGYNTWGETGGSVFLPGLDYSLGLGLNAIEVEAEVFEYYGAIRNTPSHRESQIVAPSEFYAFMDSRG